MLNTLCKQYVIKIDIVKFLNNNRIESTKMYMYDTQYSYAKTSLFRISKISQWNDNLLRICCFVFLKTVDKSSPVFGTRLFYFRNSKKYIWHLSLLVQFTHLDVVMLSEIRLIIIHKKRELAGGWGGVDSFLDKMLLFFL